MAFLNSFFFLIKVFRTLKDTFCHSQTSVDVIHGAVSVFSNNLNCSKIDRYA